MNTKCAKVQWDKSVNNRGIYEASTETLAQLGGWEVTGEGSGQKQELWTKHSQGLDKILSVDTLNMTSTPTRSQKGC